MSKPNTGNAVAKKGKGGKEGKGVKKVKVWPKRKVIKRLRKGDFKVSQSTRRSSFYKKFKIMWTMLLEDNSINWQVTTLELYRAARMSKIVANIKKFHVKLFVKMQTDQHAQRFVREANFKKKKCFMCGGQLRTEINFLAHFTSSRHLMVVLQTLQMYGSEKVKRAGSRHYHNRCKMPKRLSKNLKNFIYALMKGKKKEMNRARSDKLAREKIAKEKKARKQNANFEMLERAKQGLSCGKDISTLNWRLGLGPPPK